MVEKLTKEVVGVDFKESSVGISRFLAEKDHKDNDFMQLNGTFKHRFSDFIVNEIDDKKEVVWWKSENANIDYWKMSNIQNTIPKTDQEKNEEKPQEIVEEPQEEGDGITLSEDIIIKVKQLLTEEDCKGFLEYMDNLKNGIVEKKEMLVLKSNYSNKEVRAAIHMTFKNDVKLYETDTIVD